MKYIVQDGINFGINVNTKSPKIMSSVLHLKKTHGALMKKSIR